MTPAAESQDHSIKNAIPVCFDCHAEIHAYNPKHPRGRRFTGEELRMHKEQWLQVCETRPEIFVMASRNVDIGPIQGLLDELDYNLVISKDVELGFQYHDEQLDRAIREGVLSSLEEDLRQKLSIAYGWISRANEAVRNYNNQDSRDHALGFIAPKVFASVQAAIPHIQNARDRLLEFVASEQ
jgi:hypothetical protein